MRSSIAGAMAVIVCFGACHRAQQTPVRPAPVVRPPVVDLSADPPRLWVFAGGESEPFCLLLREDRSGVLYNGFVYLNPVHWSYDSSARRLDLVLSHLSARDYVVLRENRARGDLLAVDKASGRVSYSLDRAAPAINLFNWVLVPPQRLKDWQLVSARKGCPALDALGGN